MPTDIGHQDVRLARVYHRRVRLLLVVLLLTAGCQRILGISDAPVDRDASLPDAQRGTEIMRDEFTTYDTTVWTGASYCFNEPAGGYTPDAINGRLLMRSDDFCFRMIASVSEWQPPFRVNIDFTAKLVSGETNADIVMFVLGQDWPVFGLARAAGVRAEQPPGDVALWSQTGGSSAVIGTLATGEPKHVGIELDANGDILAEYTGTRTRMTGVLKAGAAQRMYLVLGNSVDGVDVERVVVEQLVP